MTRLMRWIGNVVGPSLSPTFTESNVGAVVVAINQPSCGAVPRETVTLRVVTISSPSSV